MNVSFDNDDGTLLWHELSQKSPSQLIREIRNHAVDENHINLAANKLPDKEPLINLLYRELFSIDERDTLLISNLTTLEMYDILSHICQQNTEDDEQDSFFKKSSITSLVSPKFRDSKQEIDEAFNDKDDPKGSLIYLLMSNAMARRLALHIAKTKTSLKDTSSFDISPHIRKLDKMVNDFDEEETVISQQKCLNKKWTENRKSSLMV